MTTPFSAIVEIGCQCGELIELPIERIRDRFDCPVCEHEHDLGDDQLDAIEAAFGRALVQAYRQLGDGDDVLPVAALRH